jgi:hypothetical protein
MFDVPLTDNLFHGAISIRRQASGAVRPWRLPVDRLALFPPDDALPERAGKPAGVRLRGWTDASAITLEIEPIDEPRLFDLVVDSGEEFVRGEAPAGGESVTFEGLPTGDKLVEIWLTQSGPVAIRRMTIMGGRFDPAPDDRPRWIHYGSSISHCSTADGPAETWPALVARRKGLDLTCLGYGGNCHLDPLVGRMIRDRAAEVITMKVGINIQGGSSLNQRTFRAMLIGFVASLRDGHPDTPIGIISALCSPPREVEPNLVNVTLPVLREFTADVVDRLKAAGDTNLYYFDGLKLFGPGLAARHMPDDVHPDGEGYRVLAGQAIDQVFSELPVKERPS